ncbi:MAG: DNA adenine methylase [Gammaproteobacteria bacterium]|nr:DNA adenine methylase [Gammaproteobacteria bacterium]
MTAALAFPTSRVPVPNVAAVPQRSPLRYPGGKTWLVPHIREWLRATRPEILIEPFAGGAIVSLTAVMEDLVGSAIMVEIDRDVAAFWHSALESGATLGRRILQFEPTRAALEKMCVEPPATVFEHGFRTLVLNRTRRGGILAPGASFARHGENGKGLLSRWYPETLAARIEAIRQYADRLIFFEGDGLKALPILLAGWGRRAAVFIDPPYTAPRGKRAGSRLYAHSEIDHAGLFRILAEVRPNFLMTYDAAPEIVELVREYDFDAVGIAMKNTHHNRISELVITSQPLFE